MSDTHASYLFTSESVTEGHPDKVCDQISDAVLDAILAKEIERAAQGYVAPMVTGEIRTQAYVDVPGIVREVLSDIGYNRAKFGFDCDTCGVLNAIHEQSPDIAQGVDESWEAQHGLAADDHHERIGVEHHAAHLEPALAARIVGLHRGSIDVQSSPGRGSVFEVRLPARRG